MRFMMLMIPKGYEQAAPGAMPVTAPSGLNHSIQRRYRPKNHVEGKIDPGLHYLRSDKDMWGAMTFGDFLKNRGPVYRNAQTGLAQIGPAST